MSTSLGERAAQRYRPLRGTGTSPAGPNGPGPTRTVGPLFLRHALGVIGRVMIGSGLIILLFVAYQLWGTGLAESRSQAALEDSFTRQLAAPAPDRSLDPAPPPE